MKKMFMHEFASLLKNFKSSYVRAKKLHRAVYDNLNNKKH